MSSAKVLPDVTSELLGCFSPYLLNVQFDFLTDSLEFQLLDDIEKPRRLRVLTFKWLRDLHVEPHDLEDFKTNCTDGIIGMHREGDEFHVHTDRYSISFHCGALHIHERDA